VKFSCAGASISMIIMSFVSSASRIVHDDRIHSTISTINPAMGLQPAEKDTWAVVTLQKASSIGREEGMTIFSSACSTALRKPLDVPSGSLPMSFSRY